MKRRRRATRPPPSIVEANAGLVSTAVAQATAGWPAHADKAGMTGVAALALIRAEHTFDPEAGASFRSYALTKMRYAIIDSARSVDPLNRHQRRDVKAVEAAAAPDPTTGEVRALRDVADLVGMTTDEVAAVRAIDTAPPLRIAAPIVNPGTDDPGLTFDPPDQTIDDVDLNLVTDERDALLHQALDALPERKRYVVQHVVLDQDKTHRDIAVEYGVTEARISQIKAEAFRALAKTCTELGLDLDR